MLVVVKIGWKEADTARLSAVLKKALAGKVYETICTAAQFADFCRLSQQDKEGTAVVFALALSRRGITRSYLDMTACLLEYPDGLTGCAGAVITDGPGELFTKKISRELIFLANQSGCAFPGKPLVEATGSLYNFNTQAAVQRITPYEAYEASAVRLIQKVQHLTASFGSKRPLHLQVLLLHASSRQTSNTLLLWEMIRSRLDGKAAIEEISLRNGEVVDCRGCSYEACLHFGEKGECFYGGVMVDQVYPAIQASNVIVLACPNYNDAVSANMTAFFNRLTALFRKDGHTFSHKRVYALVVSGYSGGDIVAEQVLDAMNCNKNFILPEKFALIETANDPNSILRCSGIADRAAAMADRILAGW